MFYCLSRPLSRNERTPRDSSYSTRAVSIPSADTKSHTCMVEQGRSVGPHKLTAAGELASALATVKALHKMRERANRGPQICGAESLGSRLYVSCCNGSMFASRRIRFHAWGCKGLHGDQGVAPEPKLSPPTSLFLLLVVCMDGQKA